MKDTGPALFVRGWHPGDLRARVAAMRPEGWNAATFAQWLEVVRTFTDMGSSGGFASGVPGRAESGMTMSAQAFEGTIAQVTLDARHIDSRAFMVLRNAVWSLAGGGAGISALGVQVDMAEVIDWSRVPPVGDDGIDVAYPEFASPTAFGVVRESSEDSRARRCVVEHAEPVPPAAVLRLRSRVDPWFELVERGGFALPDYLPPEAGSVRGGVAQLDELSVEVSLFRYVGSEALWSVLLNLLADYHFRERCLRRVYIE